MGVTWQKSDPGDDGDERRPVLLLVLVVSLLDVDEQTLDPVVLVRSVLHRVHNLKQPGARHQVTAGERCLQNK